jgi:hypothetical protein
MMKKDEMISVLAIAGAEPRVIDAMTEAYEMGFEYGSKAYVHLTDAVEHARDVCKYVDHDKFDDAKRHTEFFWSSLKKLQELE